MKSRNIFNAGLIGLFIGIAIYSTVKNGLGFFTLFSVFFIFLLGKRQKNNKELKDELGTRNLK